MKAYGTLVIALYNHPEHLPPTLNAIEFLSEMFGEIYVVQRNTTGFDWQYPSNVKLLHIGNPLPVKELEQQPLAQKIRSFRAFSRLLASTIRSSGARTVLFYDHLPLLSYRLMRYRLPANLLLWYHSHDVADIRYIRKGSISWWAWKSEKWIFPRLTLFSLPALERKAYYPLDKFKGAFFFLPNFPARKIFGNLLPTGHKQINDRVKLVYQGSIDAMHGLEEIIALLNEKPGGKDLFLVLIGPVSSDYLQRLRELAVQNNTQDRLVYIPQSGYRTVIQNALSCHIGIGIYKKQDIMNSTVGTASNKIYEYAATGMPALIYDNEHFRSALQGRSWVFFTDTSKTSLLKNMEQIIVQYERLSAAALADFREELCFERNFSPLLEYLSGKIGALESGNNNL